jgi:superfamily II DNA or RNA helicase
MDAIRCCGWNLSIVAGYKSDHKKLLGLTTTPDDEDYDWKELVSRFPEIEEYTIINPISLEEQCSLEEIIEKYNALMSRYLGIPFPEQLDEITWAMKARQIEWLLDSGHLPVKRKQ